MAMLAMLATVTVMPCIALLQVTPLHMAVLLEDAKARNHVMKPYDVCICLLFLNETILNCI